MIAPHLPPERATGRPRAWPMREIVNAIFFVVRTGCPWQLIPTDLPPRDTVYRWFAELRDARRFETINHYLVMEDHERVGRGKPERRDHRRPERQNHRSGRAARL